jgi:hypothetical protein
MCEQDDTDAGLVFLCPGCGKELVVPGAETSPEPAKPISRLASAAQHLGTGSLVMGGAGLVLILCQADAARVALAGSLLLALAAVVVAWLAFREIRASQGSLDGSREARRGLITGGVVVVVYLGLLAVLLPVVQNVRSTAARVVSQNNLKQMGLAFLNFGDTYERFPADAVRSREGKPLLSWRVTILPFIEHHDLHKQFRLDEPWDSEHNKKLIAKMPIRYALPEKRNAHGGMTHYRVFVGPGTLFPPGLALPGDRPQDGLGAAVPGRFAGEGPKRILIVEAAEPVEWTRPEELPFGPDTSVQDVLYKRRGGALAVLTDGKLLQLDRTASEEALRQAITTGDGDLPGRVE